MRYQIQFHFKKIFSGLDLYLELLVTVFHFLDQNVYFLVFGFSSSQLSKERTSMSDSLPIFENLSTILAFEFFLIQHLSTNQCQAFMSIRSSPTTRTALQVFWALLADNILAVLALDGIYDDWTYANFADEHLDVALGADEFFRVNFYGLLH